jgi:hypothetical protein
MKEDLIKSGLDHSDIMARAIDSTERAACILPHSIQGYAIPYCDLRGHPLPFYRVRAFDFLPKYKQPKDSTNHVYFPPNFLEESKKASFVLITEGEKKAALATKLGFPCIGFGGVDSWRNRVVTIPIDSELTQNQAKGILKAKLPAATEINEDTHQNLAVGMQELIDYVLTERKTIIIVYDSDQEVGVKPSVQRAAAVLGFELRFRGIPFVAIRQIVLPPLPRSESVAQTTTSNLPPDAREAKNLNKVALDDFLMEKGKGAFQELVDICLKKRSAFPRHPSIRDFINKKLQRSNMSRKDMQALSIAVLSDLDANGMRIRSKEDEQSFYFDFVTRKLLKTTFDARAENVAATPFGQFLYRRYGLGGADQRLIIWIATQFAGEDPIEEASPYHVIARIRTIDDSVHYQVSDSQFVKVDATGIELFDNGEHSVLFESGNVLPLDIEKLTQWYTRHDSQGPKLPNYWADVLTHVRLRDQDKARFIISLLYYMSPWLYRWRGMQLPVEMVIGESGSGKSTLCELRLDILSGTSKLRNAPSDLKDWHASVANTGGLHVTDNVQLVDRNLRQRLSDEICRLITEPEPTIEQRKYYTNADVIRLPVRAVFALTAIQQPFQNADLLQRSIILELDKTTGAEDGRPEITYDSEWKSNQLATYGGREGWIAHHLVVLHRFFKLVTQKWDPKYKAKHRLIHFEQAMLLMAEVLDVDPSWIPEYLSGIIDKTLGESDWTFEGIRAFVDTMGAHYYMTSNLVTCQIISEWALGEDEFKTCDMLTNSRRLARYMQTHKSIIAISCCLVDCGKRNNRQVFKVVSPKKKV